MKTTLMPRALVSIILFGALLGGCISITIPADYAEVTSDMRSLPAFDRIRIDGSTDVRVETGPVQSVEVRSTGNDVDWIYTDVENGELYIHRRARSSSWTFDWVDAPEVRVVVPALAGIEVDGSSDVRAFELNADAFYLLHVGSGDVQLSGACGNFQIDFSGSGDLRARRFRCESVDISRAGSGDAQVYASLAATVETRGSGDLTLYGGPVIDRLRTSGSGDFRIRD
jgi:Putative auto-transporter adhesin, head GIN domain